VADLIESLDVKWFPIDKALCVTENEEDENEVEILKQMKKIEVNVLLCLFKYLMIHSKKKCTTK
jgi:hypothetical protein